MKVTPDTQIAFANNQENAVMGNYPTLNDINTAYGNGFAVEWLLPQINNLSTHTGAKNLTQEQQYDLARIIATEYKFLKVTEMLLFFYRFKTGRYGRFYGSVDPMVITCALREFLQERNSLIYSYEQKRRQEERERQSEGTISYEEYLSLKKQKQ